MGRKPVGKANAFSSCLNAEIRAQLGRQKLSVRQLAEKTGIGKSRLSAVINQDEAPLNTNELDEICKHLPATPAEIVRAAESALISREYALAAEKENQPNIDEGDIYA